MSGDRQDKGRAYSWQHYVPSMYLRHWATPPTKRGYLYRFDLDKKTCERMKPKDCAAADGFYALSVETSDDPNAAEHHLGKLEDQCGPLLQHLSEGKAFTSEQDYDWFLHFVAVQFMRVPRFRKWMDRAIFERFSHLARTAKPGDELYQQFEKEAEPWTIDGRPLSPDDLVDVFGKGGQLFELHQDTKIQVSLVRAAWMVERLKQRHWRCEMTPDDAPPFICSDNPIVIIPTKANKSTKTWGILTPDTVVTMPLGPNAMILGFFESDGPPSLNNEEDIAIINTNTASTRFAYGATSDFLYRDRRGRQCLWSDYITGKADRPFSVNDESLVANTLTGDEGRSP